MGSLKSRLKKGVRPEIPPERALSVTSAEIGTNPFDRIRELQQRLDEAEETLRALRGGEVDAVVASGPQGDRVYTLVGADEPYRVMVQRMAEGALTLTLDGLILFSNEQFATLVESPLERVIGSGIQDFLAPEDANLLSALLTGRHGGKAEIRLRTSAGTLVPAYLSAENLVLDDSECICLIVTDLSQQKRNQEIVAAEKLARSILEQAAEAILVVDPDGRITRSSRQAERLAGAPVLRRQFDEVFRVSLEAGREFPFREILSAVSEGQAVQEIEATSLASDGRKLNLLLSAAILSDPDSGLLGCVIHLTDITERRRKQRQLKFQADILETTSEAVIAIDPDSRVKFWNKGAERIYGVPAVEALGKHIRDLDYPLWLNPEDKLQATARMEKQGAWSGENTHVRRDGKQICVSLTVNQIAPEHGGGMFAVVRDVTDSKQAETTLRESEARERSRAAELLAIMEAVPAAVFIARDPQGRDITANRVGYDLLRMPYGANASKSAPEEQRPQHFSPMKNGQEIPAEDLPLQFSARTGQAVHNHEFDLVFDDGASRCLLGNTVPLRDDAGRSRGAVGVFVDITERKRAEERLQQIQKRESIGLLAGGIAHDFNNLLVSVMGNASLVQEMLPSGDPALVLLEKIIKTSERLSHLTGQMLAYAGKGRFLVERLNLSHLVREMSELLKLSVPKKTTLHLELDPDLPAVEADRGQVPQVLMNLVLNAAEAIGDEGGLVTIETGVRTIGQQYLRRHPDAGELTTGTYVYLEVRDTGCGMDSETKAKIFDPFFTTKFLGRGLGLAAVQGIVRSHKGAIILTSEPGKGSCFTVFFPATAIRSDAVPQPGHHSSETAGKRIVLIVDDDQGVLELARHGLTHRGYEVLLADDGLVAIETLKTYPGEIPLVVLDLSMPRMNGEDALPELRKIQPGIRVIISSGYDEIETMARFKTEHVFGFIQKPYTLRALAEKIKSALA